MNPIKSKIIELTDELEESEINISHYQYLILNLKKEIIKIEDSLIGQKIKKENLQEEIRRLKASLP